MPQSSLAEGEVLAVGTARLAIAKEDGACSSCAANGWFFSPVNIPGCDDGLSTRPAYACLACDTITPAILWADSAATQNLPGYSCTFCQFACFMEIEIARVQHVSYSMSINLPGSSGAIAPRTVLMYIRTNKGR